VVPDDEYEVPDWYTAEVAGRMNAEYEEAYREALYAAEKKIESDDIAGRIATAVGCLGRFRFPRGHSPSVRLWGSAG
jgi:hypothetical protein